MERPRFTLKRELTFCSSQVSTNHTTTLRMHGSLGVPCIRRGLRLREGRGLPKITQQSQEGSQVFLSSGHCLIHSSSSH